MQLPSQAYSTVPRWQDDLVEIPLQKDLGFLGKFLISSEWSGQVYKFYNVNYKISISLLLSNIFANSITLIYPGRAGLSESDFFTHKIHSRTEEGMVWSALTSSTYSWITAWMTIQHSSWKNIPQRSFHPLLYSTSRAFWLSVESVKRRAMKNDQWLGLYWAGGNDFLIKVYYGSWKSAVGCLALQNSAKCPQRPKNVGTGERRSQEIFGKIFGCRKCFKNRLNAFGCDNTRPTRHKTYRNCY